MLQFQTYNNRHGREFRSQPNTMLDRIQANHRSIYQVRNLRYLRSVTPLARRIVDVGANVGIMTMEYATWAQAVEAFEPDADNRVLLQWNLHNNTIRPGLEPWFPGASMQISAQVTVHAEALAHQTGQANLCLHHSGLSNYIEFQPGNNAVPTRTLDSYAWQDVDAIKIDTEGTEWLVVQGADQTIRQCRPVVQVEIWGWERRFGLNNQDMLDYFRSLGYRQTDSRGRDLPWDFAGQITRKLNAGTSAMDRFFIP
jgi:FkbM family methyltransferase